MNAECCPPSELKRTPLYDNHIRRGGKVVPFAGWALPVQFAGIIVEHNCVRNNVGVFDVSHMGELRVTGSGATALLQKVTCNDVSKLYDGKAQYSALTTETGGVVDDIIIYRVSENEYFLCVNASNSDRDFAWISKHNTDKSVTVTNESAQWGQIALQGPKALAVLAKLPGIDTSIAGLQSFHFTKSVIAGVAVVIARTGYTGEDGVEIFVPTAKTDQLWDLILESGVSEGIQPIGLGARDSLRLEACLPLHGHELSEQGSAIESGLGWIVKEAKGDFLGRSVLAEQKAKGTKRKLAGFFIEEAGIARQGDKLFAESGAEIGVVTSGTKTPTVNRALGLAFLDSDSTALGTKIYVEVRGKKLAAQVVKTPFYKKK